MISVRVKGNFQKQFDAKIAAGKAQRMHELRDQLAAATPVDTGEAMQGWEIEGDSIVNRVDHIGALNNGSSKQAPQHFVERTLLENSDVKPSGLIVRSE